MRIGFTGTSQGCTSQQIQQLKEFFKENKSKIEELHHGDCIGADSSAHAIAKTEGVRIVIHPPLNPKARAFNEVESLNLIRREKPYLDRNRDIVDETDMLLATPKTFEEELRSGTWATIRYCVKANKPITIIYPNGSVAVNVLKLRSAEMYKPR